MTPIPAKNVDSIRYHHQTISQSTHRTEARHPPKVCAPHLCAKPWIHILHIWFLYRMGLATGLIENLAHFNYYYCPFERETMSITLKPHTCKRYDETLERSVLVDGGNDS
jgi:hypothetical protein